MNIDRLMNISNWQLAIGAIIILLLLILIHYLRRPKPLPLELVKPLTAREIQCMEILRKALPDCEILPQAGFSSFLKVVEPDNSKRYSVFNMFAKKRCDYLICDTEFNPLCIVELDDRSHDEQKDEARDRIPAAAGLETLRIDTPEEARLLEYIDGEVYLYDE